MPPSAGMFIQCWSGNWRWCLVGICRCVFRHLHRIEEGANKRRLESTPSTSGFGANQQLLITIDFNLHPPHMIQYSFLPYDLPFCSSALFSWFCGFAANCQYGELRPMMLSGGSRGIFLKFVENCCFLRDSRTSRTSRHTISQRASPFLHAAGGRTRLFLAISILNAIVALVIPFGKALLVALFFMHLRYSRRRMQVVVAGGLFWLGIMIALTMNDFLTRGWLTYR
jgi:caa(3)-type oxidase subunit IV